MATNSSTKPMVMTDTLAVDTLLIARWRDNPEFDYDAEFRGSGFSLWDWIERRIADLVDRLFGNTMLGDWSNVVWYVLGFSAIVAIVLFVFYRHPELLHVLRRGAKAKEEYEVVEDTIYGIDFPAAIAQAMSRGDYREAVRLSYLQALRHLSDANIIDWQPSKTPAQYVREYPDELFNRTTAVFIRVRYGGFEATKTMAETMAKDVADIMSKETEQKGGEQ